MIKILESIDTHEQAFRNKAWLDISREYAQDLGVTANFAALHGFYYSDSGQKIVWEDSVRAAIASSISLPPEALLPSLTEELKFPVTYVQIMNQTTLQASKVLVDAGFQPLALNFASGTSPGGGFLSGSRAQEENLCRSSALYATIKGDAMYDHHRRNDRHRASDWAILSPNVPVFRVDNGETLDTPWNLSFITSAAPIAFRIDRLEARSLLKRRIHRVLAVAAAYGYTTLVLGAWGCGAFGNDPATTAHDFIEALAGEFDGVFDRVVFAITDWSPERRFIGPFKEVFTHYEKIIA
jgi:uncharacterized protein (TIGR02452 family)